ncbi:probable protein S-acyltransferase 4 [Zingiber officinale]|uniref:probable protein S-acyltransferase 4 n=1 Tax=Zingiber officinale TaxID=94328 RepID=UPI001C4B99AD|nr:probable protein S-acyltransferase 4 [Zingiber officinale]XP_042453601.1 probable protein S-acyltransferase 4 [Zingiber officinale]
MAISEQKDESKKLRLYQAWKGNNIFFCGGRLIFGPDVASLSLSTLLIVVPAITFCCQIITKIHNHEKKPNSEGYVHDPILGIPVLILTLLITVSDLFFLFMTSSKDPGIVQRSTWPPEEDEAFNAPTASMEWISGRTPHLKLPRTKDVIVNGFAVKVKYCETCMLYRPPRASHCSVCNNCVKKFDHHCPWVGQCIGLRNYRFFCLFISTSTFLCIYIFFFSWLNIITEKKHHSNLIWKSMKHEVISLILIVYIFIVVWFVGGLTIFHCYLMSTNQTTYENFRYRYDKKDNPYNDGFWRNFKEVFFSKIPPSEHNFRSWVDAEAVEVGSYTPNISMNLISTKEKIGIEMGIKLAAEDNLNIPSILQNLDYSSIEDNVDVKVRHDGDAFDPYDFPASQKNDSYLPRDSVSKGYEGQHEVCRNEGVAKQVAQTVENVIAIDQICPTVVLPLDGEDTLPARNQH